MIVQDLKNTGGSIIIFGCGGHARSIIHTIRQIDEKVSIVMIDENAQENEVILECHAYKNWKITPSDGIIVAYGNNHKRQEKFERLSHSYKNQFVSIISPSAELGRMSKVGVGTFVAAGAYVGSEAVVGDNSIINTNSIVEHETMIGANVHIAPNVTVCGRTRIGNNVFCGAGSTVIDNISICDNVVIGAGAVVCKDIECAGTYIGVPAKRRIDG